MMYYKRGFRYRKQVRKKKKKKKRIKLKYQEKRKLDKIQKEKRKMAIFNLELHNFALYVIQVGSCITLMCNTFKNKASTQKQMKAFPCQPMECYKFCN